VSAAKATVAARAAIKAMSNWCFIMDGETLHPPRGREQKIVAPDFQEMPWPCARPDLAGQASADKSISEQTIGVAYGFDLGAGVVELTLFVLFVSVMVVRFVP
jgi:hypothetical protein